MSDDTTTSCQHLPSLQLCPTTTANSASPTTTTTTYAGSTSLSSSSPSRSSSSPADEGCASSFSQPEARSLPGHQRFAPAAGQEQEQDSQGLRSLLMLVADQMGEMRRENERLHDTIAQLCATQKETERRLARVEQDYQAIKLTQTRMDLELNQKSDHHATTHRLDHVHVHTHTCPACPPSLSSCLAAAARPAIPPQLDSRPIPPAQSSSWCVGVPHVAAAAPTTSRAEGWSGQTLPVMIIIRRPFLLARPPHSLLAGQCKLTTAPPPTAPIPQSKLKAHLHTKPTRHQHL
jgi:hypothetical protein